MRVENQEITFQGRRLLLVLDHASAADLLAANGQVLEIPAECNSADLVFRDQGGRAVLAFRQRGFVPVVGDNEREVNGCGAVVLQDPAVDDVEAGAVLRAFLREVAR